MDFQDRSVRCIDCHQEFVFTAGEQEFFDRKGFKEVPKRCKPCREKRKLERDGGGAPDERGAAGGARGEARTVAGERGSDGGGLGGGAAGGGQRERFDAICVACGSPARVPFRPVAGRAIYCRDCYANRA